MEFRCPLCKESVKSKDHRDCILTLFKENRIQSIKEWKAACYRVKKVRLQVDMNLSGREESAIQIPPTHSSV